MLTPTMHSVLVLSFVSSALSLPFDSVFGNVFGHHPSHHSRPAAVTTPGGDCIWVTCPGPPIGTGTGALFPTGTEAPFPTGTGRQTGGVTATPLKNIRNLSINYKLAPTHAPVHPRGDASLEPEAYFKKHRRQFGTGTGALPSFTFIDPTHNPTGTGISAEPTGEFPFPTTSFPTEDPSATVTSPPFFPTTLITATRQPLPTATGGLSPPAPPAVGQPGWWEAFQQWLQEMAQWLQGQQGNAKREENFMRWV